MRIHKSQLPMVASTYVEQHVMPKASGWTKVACGAFAFFIHSRLATLMEHPSVVQYATVTGIMDDKGTIDIDYLRELALHSVKETSGKFPPVMGYSLDSSDIDAIYAIAQQFGVTGV